MTVDMKPRSRAYLFHGEAMRIIALAKTPIHANSKGVNLVWKFCASRLSLKRYSNLTAQRVIRTTFGFRVFEVLSAHDLLDHIGKLVLETVWVFCRGFTPLCRTECSLDLRCRVLWAFATAFEGDGRLEKSMKMFCCRDVERRERSLENFTDCGCGRN